MHAWWNVARRRRCRPYVYIYIYICLYSVQPFARDFRMSSSSPVRDTPMFIHEAYAKMVEGLAKDGIIPDESDKDYHAPIPHTTTHVDRSLRLS